MNVEISQEIHKPPVIVFPWIAEPEKANTWQKNIQSYKIIHKTENFIGTRFRETIAEAGGSLEMDGSVIDFENNKKIIFHLESRIHELNVSYVFEPVERGSLVKIAAVIKWKFPMNVISLFTATSIKRGIVNQIRSELLELKRICEED